MVQSVVDRLYFEFGQMVDQLEATELSLRTTIEEIFQKSLSLAAASYFERRIKEDILDYVERSSGDAGLVTEFVRNKAVDRQYHSFFSWDARNANTFFSMFGEGFKNYMTALVAVNTSYRESILAFLELGSDRNRLVHQDFGAFPIEKTTTEIFELYEKALPFVDSIARNFDDYTKGMRTPSIADDSTSRPSPSSDRRPPSPVLQSVASQIVAAMTDPGVFWEFST